MKTTLCNSVSRTFGLSAVISLIIATTMSMAYALNPNPPATPVRLQDRKEKRSMRFSRLMVTGYNSRFECSHIY